MDYTCPTEMMMMVVGATVERGGGEKEKERKVSQIRIMGP